MRGINGSKVLAAALTMLGLASGACGQTGRSFPTLEGLLCQGDSVFTGTILQVGKRVTVSKETRKADDAYRIYPEGYSMTTMTVHVGEVLKGTPGKTVVLELESRAQDARWQEWADHRTELLWITGPGEYDAWSELHWKTHPDSPETVPMRWMSLRIGDPVPAESHIGGDQPLPLLSMDLTVLRTRDEVLKRARAFAETTPERIGICKFDLPYEVIKRAGFLAGIYNIVYVPRVPAMDALARRMIERPEEFASKTTLPSKASAAERKIFQNGKNGERSVVRSDGIELLAYFKSDRNAALLKTLLKDATIWGYTRPGEHGDVSGWEYAIRRKAYEVLTSWGVKVDKPVIDAPAPG